MTRERIQHVLDTIYEKVFNLGQADLYPSLVSGPYIQHNPLFPNGLDMIVGYIKQAGRITARSITFRSDIGWMCGCSLWSNHGLRARAAGAVPGPSLRRQRRSQKASNPAPDA
jgi:hypothetical protein